jgi:hypothetical protein
MVKESLAQPAVPAAAIAMEVALSVASQALRWEAEKYSQQSVVRTGEISSFENVDMQGSKTKGLGYFSIIRLIKSPEEGSQLEKLSAEDIENLEAAFTKCAPPLGKNKELLKHMLDLKTGDVLGFVGLGQLSRSSDQNIRLKLLGYRYSALKAKNLQFGLLKKYKHTDSVLGVRIKGPAGDKDYEGQQYDVKQDFDITWDRTAPTPSRWIDKEETIKGITTCKALSVSNPFREPPSDEFELEVSITESSSLKDDLIKAAETLSKAKVK